MSGSRWVIIPSWLSGSWRSFLYSFSVYSSHLFLISSASVFCTISVLYWAYLCMKCSPGITNFLEEISSLSHSIIFLYFFALITEECFIISLLFFRTLYSNGYIFPFLLCFFSSLLFIAICKASSESHFAFLHSFSLGIWFRSYLNSLVVFPNFFNWNLNLVIRSPWSEPQSAPSYFCWLYRTSPSLAAKNVINMISVLTVWWCPCVESCFVLLVEAVFYDQCFFLAKLY